MTMDTKKEIYQRFVKEYETATRERKTEIIDSIVDTTKVRRKSVIRRMSVFLLYPEGKPKRKRGRKPLFGIDVTAALKTIWEVGGEVCGVLLFPMIAEHVNILKRDKDWKHSEAATEKLLAFLYYRFFAFPTPNTLIFYKSRTTFHNQDYHLKP